MPSSYQIGGLVGDEAVQSMRTVTELIENVLPGVEIPDWVRKSTWKKQVDTWDKLLKDAKLEERVAALKIASSRQAEREAKTPLALAEREQRRQSRLVRQEGS